MSVRVFVPIVEGHGEMHAVPALLHRIAQEASVPQPIRVNPPIRIKSGSFLNDPEYFQRHVAMAAAKAAQANGFLMILLDCEDDCPAILGPSLLQRARDVRPGIEVGVFLAHREYETWFITAAPSLRGHAGLPDDLMAPADPERYRDAKGWISDHMPQPYDPIVHQLEFTRSFDLERAAAGNASFRRLRSRILQKLAP